jgi:hypothetical protein
MMGIIVPLGRLALIGVPLGALIMQRPVGFGASPFEAAKAQNFDQALRGFTQNVKDAGLSVIIQMATIGIGIEIIKAIMNGNKIFGIGNFEVTLT